MECYMECYHSFGNDVISRGGSKIWKFKVSGFKNNTQKTCILIGIIEESKIKSFIDYDHELYDEYDLNKSNNSSFNDDKEL